MTPRLMIRPEVDVDVEEATSWYEDQRTGMGLRFLGELDQLFERIVDSPLLFPEVAESVRRGLLHRFPYGVYFVPAQQRVVVLAVTRI